VRVMTVEPLTLDEDPYVRKTAAICVAKLFDINPELVEDRGFIDQLRELLADSNPMVVANAVAALAEIRDSTRSPNSVFCLDSNTVYKLLAALNECTEWGQVFILDSLSSYTAQDERDADSVIERVTPRLQHANCAVVLSAVKVIIGQLEVCPPHWCTFSFSLIPSHFQVANTTLIFEDRTNT
jgi:AP-1 complex subunit beta-1